MAGSRSSSHRRRRCCRDEEMRRGEGGQRQPACMYTRATLWVGAALRLNA